MWTVLWVDRHQLTTDRSTKIPFEFMQQSLKIHIAVSTLEFLSLPDLVLPTLLFLVWGLVYGVRVQHSLGVSRSVCSWYWGAQRVPEPDPIPGISFDT